MAGIVLIALGATGRTNVARLAVALLLAPLAALGAALPAPVTLALLTAVVVAVAAVESLIPRSAAATAG